MDFKPGDVLETKIAGRAKYLVIQAHKNYRMLKLLRGGGDLYLTRPVNFLKEHFKLHIAETMQNIVERKQKR